MTGFHDTSALMEKMRDRMDELASQKSEKKRQEEEKECPRKRVIEEIKQALDLSQNSNGFNEINKIGIMVRAKHEDSSNYELPIAIIVINEGNLVGKRLIMFLPEIGVEQVCFISNKSLFGIELLTYADEIEKIIIKNSLCYLSLVDETNSDIHKWIRATWSLSAFYKPRETREIILKHLEEAVI